MLAPCAFCLGPGGFVYQILMWRQHCDGTRALTSQCHCRMALYHPALPSDRPQEGMAARAPCGRAKPRARCRHLQPANDFGEGCFLKEPSERGASYITYKPRVHVSGVAGDLLTWAHFLFRLCI